MRRDLADSIFEKLSDAFPGDTVELIGSPCHGVDGRARDWGAKLTLVNGLNVADIAKLNEALTGAPDGRERGYLRSIPGEDRRGVQVTVR